MKLRRITLYIALCGIGIINAMCLMFSLFTVIGIKENINIYEQAMPILPFLLVLGMGLLSIIIPYSTFKLGETLEDIKTKMEINKKLKIWIEMYVPTDCRKEAIEDLEKL